MNKGLLKLALLSMVCASMPMAITSCKDYDGDIDNLHKTDDGLQDQINKLSEALKGYQGDATNAAAAAAAAAQAAADARKVGDEALAKANEAKQEAALATQAAAQAKADAVAEVKAWAEELLKNYATKADLDKLADRIKGIEETLKTMTGGSPTTNYDQAIQQLQTQVNALMKYSDLLANLQGKEDLLNSLEATINTINGQINGLTTTTQNLDKKLAEVASMVGAIKGELVTILGKQLRSLVFNPVFYYQGIEAMWAPTFEYTALDVNEKINADDNFATDAPKDLTLVRMTPALTAEYHLNPSSADLPADIARYSFKNTVKDAQYARSNDGVVTPTIYKKEVKNGKVTVFANLKDGLIKDIEKNDKVTVLALQIDVKNDKGQDTTITSDYAALKAIYTKGFWLANAKKTAHQAHWPTTMADAIASSEVIPVAWNSNGINVAEYVQTHYQLDGSTTDVAWDSNATTDVVEKSGFKYSYKLVGYTLGDNKTSESAHAALKMEGRNCILRPQMTVDGKQQPFGSKQAEASIDRLPIVRVVLTDTVSNKVAAAGYLKFQIVPDQEEDQVTVIPAFKFDDIYAAQCPLQKFDRQLSWHQVEEKVIEVLGISKTQFEEEYTPDFATPDEFMADDVKVLKQFNKAGEGATVLPVNQWVGKAGMTLYDQASSETNVVRWAIGGQQAYDIFVTGKKTSTSVVVRFVKATEVKKGSNHVQTVYHYVYVTLTWEPKELWVDPNGELSNTLKINEMWYEAWTGNHGGFAEVHMNVAVPEENDDKAANCTYVGHMLYPFKNELKLALSNIDVAHYKGYEDANLTKFFNFTALDQTTATGVSGQEYVLSVNGRELLAARKSAPLATEIIAEISENNTSSYSTWNTDDVTVTYQNGPFAKDILSKWNHLELAKGQTLAGKVAITALNKCDNPLRVINGTYNLRFLRPCNMDIKDGAKMVDAKNSGSTIAFKDFLSFTDWRSNDPISFFSTHSNYYGYYGFDRITIGKLNPATLEIEGATAGSLRDVITTNLGNSDLNSTKLSAVTPNMDIVFTPATTLSNSAMGTLTYYNNGENINKDFQIRVPIVVTYKWGYLVGSMDVTIQKTLGN